MLQDNVTPYCPLDARRGTLWKTNSYALRTRAPGTGHRVDPRLFSQAKGRIERAWSTCQDRLVSELRLAQAPLCCKPTPCWSSSAPIIIAVSLAPPQKPLVIFVLCHAALSGPVSELALPTRRGSGSRHPLRFPRHRANRSARPSRLRSRNCRPLSTGRLPSIQEMCSTHDSVLGALHSPRCVEEMRRDSPQGHKQPMPLRQAIVAWCRSLALRAASADAVMRLHRDLDRERATLVAMHAHLLVDEP